MSERNKEVERRLLEEVYSQGNLEVIDELVATDFVGHGTAAGGGDQGRDAYRRFVLKVRTAFPDLRVTIEDQIAEGDKVATRWRARGTRAGPFHDSPRTGTQGEVAGTTIDRIADGKIIECWSTTDDLGLLSRQDVLPLRRGMPPPIDMFVRTFRRHITGTRPLSLTRENGAQTMTTLMQPKRSDHDATHSSEAERFTVVVIGAGQAGLATGYHLAQRGLDFVMLEAHPRVGDSWRTRWDSLRLFSPTRYNNLPGMKLRTAGPFPTKDDLADYFEAYADRFNLPIRTSTRVQSVRPSGGDGDTWLVETSDGVLEAQCVVVATGSYNRAHAPEFASQLDPDIVQIHSHDYRNPTQYQPGPVLVVGASNSGAEISIEAAREHEVTLAGRDPGEIPFRIERPYAKAIFPILWFVANNVLTEKTPPGRKLKPYIRAHGGPLVRIKHSDVAAAGVNYTTSRVAGVRDGMPALDDGTVLDVRNVVWCTGFHSDFSWISGLTYGADGYPDQHLGAATGAPGLYFMGLKFQRAFASSLVGGAGRDAKHVVNHIAARVRQTV